MSRRITTSLLALTAALAMASSAATEARADSHARATDPREGTLKALRGIEGSDEIGLNTWIEGTVAEQVRVGDPVNFRFESLEPVYLTTIYIDASGALTILHRGATESRLVPGTVTSFPDPASNKRLIVQEPLGRETVFAIATREPLPDELFGDANREKLQLLHSTPEEARHFAQRLADYVSILPEGSVDVASFSHEVVSADTPQRYDTDVIVAYFDTNTRSISRKKLDLDIQFESGSDQLTPRAREDLDELGRALENPRMRNRRFELAGHTDDVGDAAFNMELSKRRAASAYEYLVKRYEIHEESVRTTGYGEERPTVEGTSPEARRRNRRVVIEQLP